MLSSGRPELVGGDLRHDGIGACADVGGCARDFSMTVGAQMRIRTVIGACHASQTPVAMPQPTKSTTVPHRAGLRIALVPAERLPRLGGSIRASACR